mgnify:CR=1 FL=1
MFQGFVEKTQTLIKTLLGTRSDWRLTKPAVPHLPKVTYIWIGPVMAVFTIFIGWFAFTKTVGDGNAAFALFIGSVSIMMMTWSNLLSTRILPLEQIFGGVDRMYVWHRWLGALSVGAMWLHLETVDDVKGIRGASRNVADAAEDLAETGSTILYILVGISLLRWIPTRWWRLTHKLLVLPYAFSCWHFYTSTKPYANASLCGAWFTGFMLLGLAAWLYRVLWRDIFRKGKLYVVSHIEHTGNVLTIEIEPVGAALKYQLGQFAFLKMKVPGLREPHPFTIASSPDEKCLRFVIRDLGDWTHRLASSLALNDRIVVEGPYGHLAPMPHHPVDHIIWVAGGVDDHMSTIVQAQLMFLDNLNNNDITMHVDSPGGSVKSGLSMVDVMRYIKSDVATINTGMAASMGSILLSSGTKGKRSSLNFSKVMIHQVSSGAQGHVQDNRISQMESEKYNYILFKMLAENSGRSFDEVLESARRDKWLNSQEALDFGFIDEIIVSDKTSSITTLMDGFEDYYTKEVLKK